MRIVLAGQPNSGKSTIFNTVAGYKSMSSNFPGSTVEYTLTTTRINGQMTEVVDLPGTYHLAGSSPAEKAATEYLLNEDWDVVVHILDASLLQRGLELTLQLIEMQTPIVVCLNMMDDAQRKGIRIDTEKLSEVLGVPVTATIGRTGKGVRQLFELALQTAQKPTLPSRVIHCHKDVEDIILAVANVLDFPGSVTKQIPRRFLAIQLLEGDGIFPDSASTEEKDQLFLFRRELEQTHGRPAEVVLESERHALAMAIAESATFVDKPIRSFRDRLDDILMHRIGGYIFLFVILLSFFVTVFKFGGWAEDLLLRQFHRLGLISGYYSSFDSLLQAILGGILGGITGGLSIVLPYLIPFFIGLSILEDTGYLPRVAFLMDALLHRMGLHGTAILPAMLGYGCNVPAVLATRILPSRRDRIIAGVLSLLVPCSARSTVILALVGYYLGGLWAFTLYALNIVVIVASGRWMSSLMPQLTPGMILEVPRYQIPAFRLLLRKVWFRMREFVRVAWPLLIAGSVLLSIGQYYKITGYLDAGLAPLTVHLLGLPLATGTTLIFGILRKELSLLMLMQALGTTDVLSVMSAEQILVFTIFVMFYIPCVATIGVFVREMGKKISLYAVAYTFVLSTLVAFTVRSIFRLAEIW